MAIKELETNIIRVRIQVIAFKTSACSTQELVGENSHNFLFLISFLTTKVLPSIYMQKYYLGISYIHQTTLNVYESCKLYFLYDGLMKH